MQLYDFYATLYLSGDFSIDGGKGSENVTIKMNSHQFFQLCRVYSSLLKTPKVGEFPGLCFLGAKRKFRKKKKNLSRLLYVLHKT